MYCKSLCFTPICRQAATHELHPAKPIEENLYWKYSGICIPVVFSLVIIIIIILLAQQYNSMHICTNTILEEQDSKVR